MSIEEGKPLTTRDLVITSGLTLRQVNHAIETGKIVPIDGRKGHGHPFLFPPEVGYNLWLVKMRLDWGLSFEAAWRDEDPYDPVPPAPNFQ